MDFSWTKTYIGLAYKLAAYRNNREELIEKIAAAFATLGMKTSTPEKERRESRGGKF